MGHLWRERCPKKSTPFIKFVLDKPGNIAYNNRCKVQISNHTKEDNTMTYMITWTETATGNFYTENVNGCELLDRLMDSTIYISEAYLAPDFTTNIADDLRIEL